MGGLLMNPMEQPMNALLRLLESERRRKFDTLDLQGQEQTNELNKIRLNDVRGDVADEEQLRGILNKNEGERGIAPTSYQTGPTGQVDLAPDSGAPLKKSPIRLQLEFLAQDPRRRDKFIALQNALINELQQLEQQNPDAAAQKWEEYFGVPVSQVGRRSDYVPLGPHGAVNVRTGEKIGGQQERGEKLGPEDTLVDPRTGKEIARGIGKQTKEPTSLVGLFANDPAKAQAYMEMDAKIKSKYKLDRNPSVAEFMTNLYKSDPETFDAVFNRNQTGKDEDRAIKIVQLAQSDQFSEDPLELRVEKITQLLRGGSLQSDGRPRPIASHGNGLPKTGQQAPAVGTIKRGYRFKGGDPSKQENWEKVQ